MASVDDTVRQFITSYPSLAKNRTEVLHFILCVTGNDWHWVGGEAVSDSPSKAWTADDERASLEDGILSALHPERDADTIDLLRTAWGTRIRELEGVVATAEERVHQEGTIEQIHPQDEWALLMRIPDDVTDEWRTECEKMREIVARDGGWVF